MASLSEHIAAREDRDLTARVRAAAERAGIPNPQGWAEANMGALVSVDVSDATTLADVHAYAVGQYVPQLPPGADPALVRDDQIVAAVAAVREAQTGASA